MLEMKILKAFSPFPRNLRSSRQGMAIGAKEHMRGRMQVHATLHSLSPLWIRAAIY